MRHRKWHEILCRNVRRTECEERVFWLEQHENAMDQVLVGDVVLDVVRVVLNAERQQFHDDWQQVSCLVVICSRARAHAHTHTLVQSPMRNTNGITNSVSNADVLQNPCTAGPTIAAVPFYISYKNLPIHVVYFMRKSQYDNCRKFQDPWTKTFLWVTKARDWRDNS